MNSPTSLAGRAVLAVLLMIGFYLLALAIAAGLVYIVVLEVATGHFNLKITALCLVGAGMILWSILPRSDRFEAPGSLLSSSQHPRLFKSIQDVAKLTEQTMPTEVYLVGDVNAFVTERGGVMGFGSRRVMGIGLPLLEALTVSQLRGVLAHEFGHYYGGDTKLGPWIYKTRLSIVRTVMTLHQQGRNLLKKPFEWYGALFLRITQSVSRQQEYTADSLAARIVGSRTMIDGLQAVSVAGAAYDYYWKTDIAPVLDAGFRPALLEGFRHFISGQRSAGVYQNNLEQMIKQSKTDPFDTHPSLKDRINALTGISAPDLNVDNAGAISLIENVDQLEANWLLSRFGEQVAALKTIDWKMTTEKVYFNLWMKRLDEMRSHLEGVTIASLPQWLKDDVKRGVLLADFKKRKIPENELTVAVGGLLGIAIIVFAHSNGCEIEYLPGHSWKLTIGNSTFDPFRAIGELVEGKTSEADWLALFPIEDLKSKPLIDAVPVASRQ